MGKAPALVLVILQNDLGTTLVFLMTGWSSDYVRGLENPHPNYYCGWINRSASIYLVVYNRQILLNIGFKNYQFARIDSWLD